MPIIKFIGRPSDFKGKTLWEILGNLKNFGVGRTVVRSKFADRYPQKCYFKIMSVVTHPRGAEIDTRKVEVIAEKTFRGKVYSHPTKIYISTFKPDFRLLSKEEEKEYCKVTEVYPDRVLPRQMEIPPLLKKVIFREYEKKGIEPNVDMTFDVHQRQGINKFYRFAEASENTEIFPCTLDIDKTPSPSLYKGLDFPTKNKSK